MKVTIVLGSPRENGVSTKIAQSFAKGAAESGHEVVTYDINKMNVAGCQGCGACRANGTDCVLEDDFRAYLKDLRESQALVVTSPNYYTQIAGPMITFMNRHYCLLDKTKTPRLEDTKKVFGFFAQGAPEGYESYIPNYEWYMSTFTTKNMELGKLLVCGGNSDVEAFCEEAYKAGKDL